MNKYGEPLVANSTQSILPAMFESGKMIGWYSIASTEFDGTETVYTLPDGVELPITTVTLDADPTQPGRVEQYVAAVFSDGTPFSTQPWSSIYLRRPEEGYMRMYSLPTQAWTLRYQPSILQAALLTGMDPTVPAPVVPEPPDVTTPATLMWKASIAYTALLGDCLFFDFNWVELFKAKSSSEALRIEIVSNPAPIAPSPQPPMVAQIIGIPVSVGAGAVRYDTIRIMKLQDVIPADDYEFAFNVYSEDGLVTPVTLTLTVQ